MPKNVTTINTEATAAIRSLFYPMEEMYDAASTPEEKEQLEKNLIMVFNNIIKAWQDGRRSGY